MSAPAPGRYPVVRSELLERLRQEPALANLQIDEEADWIVALCDAWAALAEVFGFYQERIIEEAFLATAQQLSSVELLYHSLGHAFPPNATATTALAYQLSSSVAGVEAVTRARAGGGTGTSQEERARLAGGGVRDGDPGPVTGPSGPGGLAVAGDGAGDGLTGPGTGVAGQAGPAAPGGASTGAGLGGLAGGGALLDGGTSTSRLPIVGAPAGITTQGGELSTPASEVGVASQVPPAAQVRAIPTSSGNPPVFVTLAPLGAYVGASQLQASVPATTAPPALSAATTQLELDGTKTGLATGQPVLVAAADPGDGTQSRWPRVLTTVSADAKRGSTRIGWDQPLGALTGEAPAEGAADPVVYGFSSASQLVGANAPDWISLTSAQRLAITTNDGVPVPVRGGFARSADGGTTWMLDHAGLPTGADLTAVGSYGDVTIVSAGQSWLLRSVGGAPFVPAALGGGPRRAVGFLGGTSARMLAGAAGGIVYESFDLGQTWSAVSGSAPVLAPAPPPGDKAAAKDKTPGSQTVTTNQLPATTVRCVIGDPSDKTVLLAGTDAGLYSYTEGNWAPAPITVDGVALTVAVFGLAVRGGVVAATTAGVFARSTADSTWGACPAGKFGEATYAVAEAGGSVYAATETGVWTDADGSWRNASGSGDAALPAGAKLNALLAVPGGLLAATADGIYRSIGTSPDLSWARCDHAAAFAIPRDAFEPPASGSGEPAPPGLLAAFAVYGIALGSAAGLEASGNGCVLADGAHSYQLEPASDAWQVTLLDALPGAAALAVTADGGIVAAAAAATSVANQWPGFAVAGTMVEIAPPLRSVAPRLPALIEQRTPMPSSQVLDVVEVAQDSGVRAGRQTQLTRIEFTQNLVAGEFPRRVSTVWTGSAPLPLFDPPPAAVAQVSGKGVTLASQLPAPVEPGRLATVTGAPPGLAVAPLGGVLWIASPGAAPLNVGPPQADVVGIAVGSDGTGYLATSEGVFEADPGTPAVTLLDTGWPAGPCPALAFAGDTLLAASSSDVQVMVPRSGGAASGWSPAGLGSVSVLTLSCSDSSAVAGDADGNVYLAHGTNQPAMAWTKLPPLPQPATALALIGATIYAATAGAVFTLDTGRPAVGRPDGWSPLDKDSRPAAVSCLEVDGTTLWAGSSGGLQSLDPATGEWRPDPAVTGAIQALCVTPIGALLAAGSNGVMQRTGPSWTSIAPTTGASLAAVAGAPDGSVWLGARAALPLPAAPGSPAQQVSHAPVFTGVGVGQRDIDTLAQAAVPDVLLAAFADGGTALDPSHVVVAADGSDCWMIRSADELFVVTKRSSAAGLSLSAYRNQAVLYPTAAPSSSSGVQTWPVEVGGVAATLTAPAARLVYLPAGSDAPALAESATVATIAPGEDPSPSPSPAPAPPPAPTTPAPSPAPPASPAASATGAGPDAGTTLTFQQPLTHVYDASTVQVNLNVVPAAQGQPVSIPIGSGDPQAAHQSFAVPTPIAAIGPTPANPSAPAPTSTLQVYVDGQPWREVQTLHRAGRQAQVYIARHNADGSAIVTFGDGEHGARLPAGNDNVVATYLQGGGPGGEVAQGALIQPLNRPQLVKGVLNPLAALVPATPPARRSRLAAVRRLDRIVTLGDYEDVAGAQAGVATASAELVGGAPGRGIVITVARGSSAPLDLIDRVQSAVGFTSASGLPVRVVAAEMVPVELSLSVVSPYRAIAPSVAGALAGLAARRPGAPLLAAQVLYAATAVPGVVAASIVGWARAGRRSDTSTSLAAARASWPRSHRVARPAELLLIDGDHLEVRMTPPPKVEQT